MEPALKDKGHQVSFTRLYDNQGLPAVADIDWLIIMGGPMGIYDEAVYPWLSAEKAFIKEAIAAGKPVLGICLGAQLIADVLGAKVIKNKYREIGWFDIERTAETENTILSAAIPARAEVFHWHGDTFEIPEGAMPLAKSIACENQGFILDNRVIAFQFHLETTPQSAKALIDNCRDELDGSQYVQSEDELLSEPRKFAEINQIMFRVLEAMERVSAE